MCKFLFKRQAIILAAVLLCGSVPNQARTQEGTELERNLDSLVAQVADVLKANRSDRIKSPKVRCREKEDDPQGAWIEQAITMRLKSHKIQISNEAGIELFTEYSFQASSQHTGRQIVLESRILKDGAGQQVLPKITSTDMRDKLRLAGSCISIPPNGTKQERSEAFDTQCEQPGAFLSGDQKTRISPSKNSPYYVEMLAGPKGGKGQLRERKASVEGGKALAQIDRDEEYRIRIANNSKTESACQVFIDGINIFEFSEDRKANGDSLHKYFLVSSGKVVDVPGWHRSATGSVNWNAFVVTKFGDGVASLVNPKGKVGSILVMFSNSFDPSDPTIGYRSSDLETSRGRNLEGKQDVFVRKVDLPHETIAVRYTRGISPK